MFELFHPGLHPLFETLGYVGGFAVYRHARRSRGDFVTEERHWVVIASAAVDPCWAAAFSAGLLEQFPQDGLHWQRLLQEGKQLSAPPV